MSPGDCWIWPARGYAGEADVATFIDGDVRRDLGNFRRHCRDTKREMKMQPVLSVLNLKTRVKEAEFPSFYRDKQSRSPSVSSASTGKRRGNRGVGGDRVDVGRTCSHRGFSYFWEAADRSYQHQCDVPDSAFPPTHCWYRPCPPSHELPFPAELRPPRTTPALQKALLVQGEHPKCSRGLQLMGSVMSLQALRSSREDNEPTKEPLRLCKGREIQRG